MSEPDDPTDGDGAVVSAFVGEVSGASANRLGPKLLGAGLAVAVLAGIAVAVGVMTKPKPATATTATKPTTAATAPAASPTGAAPGGTAQATSKSPDPAQQGGVTTVYVAGGGQDTTSAHPSGSTENVRPQAQSSPPPDPSPTATRSVPATTAPAPAFDAITGVGCPMSASATESTHGWYDSGSAGFVHVPQGGWGRLANCNGSFDAMPLSGSTTADDPSNYALWVFRPGTSAKFQCKVAVFVPNDGGIQHNGGAPAHYEVFDNAAASGSPIGAFDVDQPRHVNSWVDTGSYPAAGGILAVKLVSRGLDFDPNSGARNNRHAAISQIHVSCTG